MRDHSRLVKLLLDIDIRYFTYNMDAGARGRGRILHALASSGTFLVMSFIPIVHSIMFMWFSFLDIVTLNRLALYISYLQLLRHWGNKIIMTPRDWFLLGEVLFVCLNFTNRAMLLPTLFYILDEMWEIPRWAHEMEEVSGMLLGVDKFRLLSDVSVFFGRHRVAIHRARVAILGAFLLWAIAVIELRYLVEIPFYYGATARIIQLLWE